MLDSCVGVALLVSIGVVLVQQQRARDTKGEERGGDTGESGHRGNVPLYSDNRGITSVQHSRGAEV